jgi:hypothetical protein
VNDSADNILPLAGTVRRSLTQTCMRAAEPGWNVPAEADRPSWAIRKPTPGVLQPSVKPVQQPTALGDAIDISTKMAEICSWPALDKHDVPQSAVHGFSWSGLSLEDDLVHDSVGSNNLADSHNDNGK